MPDLTRRLQTVYGRYRRTRCKVVSGPYPLRDAAGHVVGYLESVTWLPQETRVRGWTTCPEMTLSRADQRSVLRPSHERGDLAASGVRGGRGFTGFLDGGRTGIRVTAMAPGAAVDGKVRGPGPLRLLAAETRTLAAFGALLWTHRDEVRAYLRSGDLRAAQVLRRKTGLFGEDETRRLSGDVYATSVALPPGDDRPPVHIILPVYGNAQYTAEVGDRVLSHSDLPFRLIIVDDASPDSRMRDVLDGLAARAPDLVEVIRFEQNMGFVAAANAGLERAVAANAHAVLLNSDAFPPPGWLSRLLAPIAADDSIASVTPFSNAAEILSVPSPDRPARLEPGEGDRIDLAARQMDPARAILPVPVGIGFCMAMNYGYLARLPSLDTVFGRGYGEEVDWCRKAEKLGGRHVAVGNLFVHHEGGASFGSDEKRERVARNNAIVDARHPTHTPEVQRFLEHDPVADHRAALALAWAAARSGPALPVYLAHALGGGADTWLQSALARDQGAGSVPIVVRTGGAEPWTFEIRAPGAPADIFAADTSVIQSLLSHVGPLRLVYSCGVGTPEPEALVTLLRRLADVDGASLEILFHDFFPVSPSYTLVGGDGVYAGVPDRDDHDPAHAWPGVPGYSAPMSLAGWRDMWTPLLSRADTIRVFSDSSRQIVAAAYPDLARKIEVRPHHAGAFASWSVAGGGDRVIGVLGSLNAAKGAAVLEQISFRLAAEKNAPGLVLVGSLDPSYRLARPAIVHGSYRRDMVPRLTERYGIGCWLMPSVWPETFSFATHEMLATGRPVFGYDLGAQGAAVRAAGNGHILAATPGNADQTLTEIMQVMGW